MCRSVKESHDRRCLLRLLGMGIIYSHIRYLMLDSWRWRHEAASLPPPITKTTNTPPVPTKKTSLLPLLNLKIVGPRVFYGFSPSPHHRGTHWPNNSHPAITKVYSCRNSVSESMEIPWILLVLWPPMMVALIPAMKAGDILFFLGGWKSLGVGGLEEDAGRLVVTYFFLKINMFFSWTWECVQVLESLPLPGKN